LRERVREKEDYTHVVEGFGDIHKDPLVVSSMGGPGIEGEGGRKKRVLLERCPGPNSRGKDLQIRY